MEGNKSTTLFKDEFSYSVPSTSLNLFKNCCFLIKPLKSTSNLIVRCEILIDDVLEFNFFVRKSAEGAKRIPPINCIFLQPDDTGDFESTSRQSILDPLFLQESFLSKPFGQNSIANFEFDMMPPYQILDPNALKLDYPFFITITTPQTKTLPKLVSIEIEYQDSTEKFHAQSAFQLTHNHPIAEFNIPLPSFVSQNIYRNVKAAVKCNFEGYGFLLPNPQFSWIFSHSLNQFGSISKKPKSKLPLTLLDEPIKLENDQAIAQAIINQEIILSSNGKFGTAFIQLHLFCIFRDRFSWL